jgi:hypothetical protein
MFTAVNMRESHKIAIYGDGNRVFVGLMTKTETSTRNLLPFSYRTPLAIFGGISPTISDFVLVAEPFPLLSSYLFERGSDFLVEKKPPSGGVTRLDRAIGQTGRQADPA